MPKETDRKKGFCRYLTYSEEDEKWQLVCTDAGYNEVPPHTMYPANKEAHPKQFKSVALGRTLDEYQIVYITNGRGVFEASQKTYVVVPGTIMLVLPGVRHFYKPEYDVGWTEYWVGFKGPYADTLRVQGILSDRKPVYAVGLQNSLLGIYDRIHELVQDQQPLYQVRASSLVHTLLAEILAHERGPVQHLRSERLVERAKFVMEENIYREINLDGLGEILAVSTSRLNEVFKSHTSMTPYQYFISIKIRKAKDLLETGGLTVKEVAYRLGFDDPYYFSRLFRRKAGLSPSRWRVFASPAIASASTWMYRPSGLHSRRDR